MNVFFLPVDEVEEYSLLLCIVPHVLKHLRANLRF